jgi:hypothetical protein
LVVHSLATFGVSRFTGTPTEITSISNNGGLHKKNKDESTIFLFQNFTNINGLTDFYMKPNS